MENSSCSEVIIRYFNTLHKYEGYIFIVNRSHSIVVANGKKVRKGDIFELNYEDSVIVETSYTSGRRRRWKGIVVPLDSTFNVDMSSNIHDGLSPKLKSSWERPANAILSAYTEQNGVNMVSIDHAMGNHLNSIDQ